MPDFSQWNTVHSPNEGRHTDDNANPEAGLGHRKQVPGLLGGLRKTGGGLEHGPLSGGYEPRQTTSGNLEGLHTMIQMKSLSIELRPGPAIELELWETQSPS